MLTMPIAFGQDEMLGAQKISLTSDNTAYQEGDVITITGTIEKVIPGMPVTLQIFFDKNLLQVSQVKVSQDGKFTDTFTAAGPQWQNEGTVMINADYGGSSTELNIEFFKNTSGEFTSNYEVKIPAGGTFDVQYTMKGGIVSTMNLNQENLSLVINISTSSDGNLNINLPRDSIDSINNNGEDIEFIVLMYEENSEIPIQTDFKKVDILIKKAFENDDQNIHFQWIEILLNAYYDKMYDYQLEKKIDRCEYSGTWESVKKYLISKKNNE